MKLKRTGTWWLVVGLLAVGLWLRLYHLEQVTTTRPDENLWWEAGTSLVQEGVPTTWTITWPYHNWEAYWQVDGGVVTPWLDHPPLFALLIVAWWQLVDGGMEPIWFLLRLPMIAVAGLTMLLTYLFVRRLWGERLALFTLAAYVFFPSAVVSARFVLPENLIPLWLMLALYSLVFYRSADRRGRGWLLAWLLVLSASAPLFKLSGMLVPATVVLWWLWQRRYRLALVTMATTGLALGGYLLYAWSYSWEVFVGANAAHVLRPQSFFHFWSLFTHLNIGNFVLYDPSIIVGLIGLFVLMAVDKTPHRRRLIVVPLLVVSLLFLYVAPTEAYGWYKFQIYPLLALGIGFVLYQLDRERPQYLVLFLPLLGMMMEHSLLIGDQVMRKQIMAVLYLLALTAVIWQQSWWRLRYFVWALLPLLFLFEVVWVRWAIDL